MPNEQSTILKLQKECKLIILIRRLTCTSGCFESKYRQNAIVVGTDIDPLNRKKLYYEFVQYLRVLRQLPLILIALGAFWMCRVHYTHAEHEGLYFIFDFFIRKITIL